MIGASKILTVSYGTFSCTLEGFDEPFNTMKAIAEYFRDLAAEDRYFGAEPPTPDAAMLHRIAEREIQRRVEAKIQDNGVILRAADVASLANALPAETAQVPAPSVAATNVQLDGSGESIAARLSRLRSGQNTSDQNPADQTVAHEPLINHVSEAAAVAAEAYTEDQHADDISANVLSNMTAFAEEQSVTSKDMSDNFDQIDVDFDHTESALDELIAAEVIADRQEHLASDEIAAGETYKTVGAETEIDLYDLAEQQPEEVDEDSATADQFADQLPEDEAEWQATPEDAGVFSDPTVGVIEEVDQSSPTEGMTPRQQRRLVQHLQAVEAAKAAARQDNLIEESDDDALLESLSNLDIPAASLPAADIEEDLLELAPEEPVQRAEPKPAAPAPQVSENIQRARARVIKIRRADAPVAAPTAAPAAVLSPEAEADLEAELATLRAESEPVTPTRPTRPVRNLAARPPVAPAPSLDDKDEDDQLAAAVAALRIDDATPIEPQPVAAEVHTDPTHPAESRKRLEPESDDDAVSRLMKATNTAMDGAENRRRHAAISHLKAAVAATEAERQIKAANPGKPEVDRQDIYRNDLESVVRPRSIDSRPIETRAEARAASNAERPTPLVLVSEQRIDRPKATITPATAPVAPRMVLPNRPRRIAPNPNASVASLQMNDTLLGQADDDLEDDETSDAAEDANYFAPSESFDDFAEKLGATSLSELLEASAVYCAQVLGRPQFSRTMVMHQVQSLIDAPDHNLEDSLRGFGTLLRQGRLAKIKRGHFAVTDRSPMLAEALRIAG